MLWQDHFSIDKHGKARGALVLDLGADPSEALAGRKMLTVGAQHFPKVDLDFSGIKNLLVNGVKLLVVFPKVISHTVLGGNQFHSLYQFVNVLLRDVNVSRNHHALLSALLNVDSLFVEEL